MSIFESGNYTVIDIETNGFSRTKDSIIEISAVRYRGFKSVWEFSKLVRPVRPINKAIQELTGITNNMAYSASPPEKVLQEFRNFVSSDTVVGWNIHTFDNPFIDAQCRKYINKPFENASVDVMELAKKLLPNLPKYKQAEVAQHFNISTEGSHRAVNDCIICNEIFLNLIQMMK